MTNGKRIWSTNLNTLQKDFTNSIYGKIFYITEFNLCIIYFKIKLTWNLGGHFLTRDHTNNPKQCYCWKKTGMLQITLEFVCMCKNMIKR